LNANKGVKKVWRGVKGGKKGKHGVGGKTGQGPG